MCARGRSIRNPPLFLRSQNCQRPATRRTIFFLFSKFPIVITQRPSSLSLLFSLPFNLIYRPEQIFEQDATARLTPANFAGWFARVSSVSRYINQPVYSRRIFPRRNLVCNINEGITKFLLLRLTSPPTTLLGFNPLIIRRTSSNDNSHNGDK